MDVTLFKPHKGQKRIIDGFIDSPHKFCVVSTGRQYGKSLLAQNMMLWWLLKRGSMKGCWIAPIYKQCGKVYDELSTAANKIIRYGNKSELKLEFINGSTLQFLSAEKGDSIRGFSFDYMVIDEAAFIRQDTVLEAILPTLSARGKKCLIISTPRSKNWFFEWFYKQGEDYIQFKGQSTDNPHIDLGFIDEQRKSLPDSIYRQEYLAEFSESGNDVFRNLDEACIIERWNDYTTRTGNYFSGIDTAVSSDFAVCSIIGESGETVSIIRINGRSLEETGNTFIRELKRWNVKQCIVETNGVGQGMFELIRKSGIKTIPQFTNNTIKVQNVRLLINDIETAQILLPSKNLMPECYAEFAQYTYKYSPSGTIYFSHPPGGHDDIVDSIAMANAARNKLHGSDIYVGGMDKIKYY